MTRALLALAVAALAVAPGSAQQLELVPAHADAIERWTDAVMSHTPGQADTAVRAVWALTREDRRALHPGMAWILDAIADKRITTRTPVERRIVDIGLQLARNPGNDEFLKRAIVLHGDAAMAGFLPPLIRPAPPGAQPLISRALAMREPLLVDRALYLENDGQVVGMTVGDWNWIFARSLIARLRAPASDPFVGQWFHATMAFMFKNRVFGEVQWHLDHAAAILPNDARILLDRGSAAEHQGLPRSQSALSEEDVVVRRDLGVASLEVSNRNAEGFYRRAVERDARLFEARVRLARLLTLRSKYAEALAMIEAAPAGTPPDTVAMYYGHLFAARAERGLGRLEAATIRIDQARTLFPDAQSALMAASHIAMLRADEAGAEEPMRHLALLPFDRSFEDDPWWVYETFTGRYAEALVTEMWKTTGFSPRVPLPSSAR
jgi:tetratricopeptide (TPR) repeat protein